MDDADLNAGSDEDTQPLPEEDVAHIVYPSSPVMHFSEPSQPSEPPKPSQPIKPTKPTNPSPIKKKPMKKAKRELGHLQKFIQGMKVLGTKRKRSKRKRSNPDDVVQIPKPPPIVEQDVPLDEEMMIKRYKVVNERMPEIKFKNKYELSKGQTRLFNLRVKEFADDGMHADHIKSVLMPKVEAYIKTTKALSAKLVTRTEKVKGVYSKKDGRIVFKEYLESSAIANTFECGINERPTKTPEVAEGQHVVYCYETSVRAYEPVSASLLRTLDELGFELRWVFQTLAEVRAHHEHIRARVAKAEEFKSSSFLCNAVVSEFAKKKTCPEEPQKKKQKGEETKDWCDIAEGVTRSKLKERDLCIAFTPAIAGLKYIESTLLECEREALRLKDNVQFRSLLSTLHKVTDGAIAEVKTDEPVRAELKDRLDYGHTSFRRAAVMSYEHLECLFGHVVDVSQNLKKAVRDVRMIKKQNKSPLNTFYSVTLWAEEFNALKREMDMLMAMQKRFRFSVVYKLSENAIKLVQDVKAAGEVINGAMMELTTEGYTPSMRKPKAVGHVRNMRMTTFGTDNVEVVKVSSSCNVLRNNIWFLYTIEPPNVDFVPFPRLVLEADELSKEPLVATPEDPIFSDEEEDPNDGEAPDEEDDDDYEDEGGEDEEEFEFDEEEKQKQARWLADDDADVPMEHAALLQAAKQKSALRYRKPTEEDYEADEEEDRVEFDEDGSYVSADLDDRDGDLMDVIEEEKPKKGEKNPQKEEEVDDGFQVRKKCTKYKRGGKEHIKYSAKHQSYVWPNTCVERDATKPPVPRPDDRVTCDELKRSLDKKEYNLKRKCKEPNRTIVEMEHDVLFGDKTKRVLTPSETEVVEKARKLFTSGKIISFSDLGVPNYRQVDEQTLKKEIAAIQKYYYSRQQATIMNPPETNPPPPQFMASPSPQPPKEKKRITPTMITNPTLQTLQLPQFAPSSSPSISPSPILPPSPSPELPKEKKRIAPTVIPTPLVFPPVPIGIPKIIPKEIIMIDDD